MSIKKKHKKMIWEIVFMINIVLALICITTSTRGINEAVMLIPFELLCIMFVIIAEINLLKISIKGDEKDDIKR